MQKLERLVALADKKPADTPPTGDGFAPLTLLLVATLSAAAALVLLKRKRQ